MPAVLYDKRLGYNQRILPWHGDGNIIADDIDVVQAVKDTKLDYSVALGTPYGFILDDKDKTIVTDDQIHGESNANAMAVLRLPNYGDDKFYVLGKASQRFSILQNIDLARIVEPLRKWGRVETVGAVDDGARFFIVFEGDKWAFTLHGIEFPHQMYLIVKNTHLPGQALQFQTSNVCVVCKNTWMQSDSNALMNIPLEHKGNLELTTSWVVAALTALAEQKETAKSMAEYMGDLSITDDQVKQGIRMALPLPKQTRLAEAVKNEHKVPEALRPVLADVDQYLARQDNQLAVASVRIQALQDAAFRTYQESDTVVRGTAWGAFSAFTETVDHVVRSATAKHQTAKAATANFMGERAGWKQQAFTFFTNPRMWDN